MFTVEKILTEKSASSSSINNESRKECENIMKKIYDENPSYWPYGLNVDAHDGGVYMIREASTRKPVGFTGWQERNEDGCKVGYYSIGILPEYRHNGYAKQAVAKLINIKAATVDRVQALIMNHNKPSLALAEALHLPVVKAGSYNNIKKAVNWANVLKYTAGGVLGTGAMDALSYGRDKSWEEYKNTPMTVSRVINGLVNAGLGTLAGKPGMKLHKRVVAIGALPVKDLALASVPAVPSIAESLKTLSNKEEIPGFMESLSPTQKALGAGGGIAALLGAGYLGHKAVKALNGMSEAQKSNAGGKVRVSLPTKDPNDEETSIELPMGNLAVSSTQLEKLQRDLRRRIRKETKERTVQRTTQHLLEPKEAHVRKSSLQKVNNLLNIIYG